MNDEDRDIAEGIEEYEDNIRELSWEDSDGYYDDDPYSGEMPELNINQTGLKSDRLGDVILESCAYYSDYNYLNNEIMIGEQDSEYQVKILYGHMDIKKIATRFIKKITIGIRIGDFNNFAFNVSDYYDLQTVWYFTKTVNAE